MTKVVLENVPVLAAGEQLAAGENGDGPNQADIYTLELTPHESEKLALASTQGTLHFALRNASDTETVLTEGADARTALASYRSGAARTGKARAAASTSVEFISGGTRSLVSFPAGGS
jgi:pilus assembly protein CpaB